jgi:mono/diheme cytochrome c family protein
MSRQSLNAMGIAGFLLAAVASVIAPTGAPIAAQERGPLVARGQALFVDKGCHGCHRIANVGTAIGPDLSRVGEEYREDDLTRWLSPSGPAPSGLEPTPGRPTSELEPAERDTSHLPRHMPTPRLSESEARALAAYLASLGEVEHVRRRGAAVHHTWTGSNRDVRHGPQDFPRVPG